jgi:hypothetical protein
MTNGGTRSAIYVDDDMDFPSDTDDEEERRDYVHDIHGDGEEADVEDDSQDNMLLRQQRPGSCQNRQILTQSSQDRNGDEDNLMETERRARNDSSMDGDIEDAD